LVFGASAQPIPLPPSLPLANASPSTPTGFSSKAIPQIRKPNWIIKERNAFNGLTLAIIRHTGSPGPGTIVLKAESPGLAATEVKIRSRL
jgi:hypothetical protein